MAPNEMTNPAASADDEGPAQDGARRRTTTRALLITGAAVGALALAGVTGAAIGSRMSGPTGATPSLVAGSGDSGSGRSAETGGAGSDTASPGSAPILSVGTASAAELSALLTAATATAAGTPVSIEANRDGSWDVEIEDDQNTETTVRIATDGTATVIEVDRDDDRDRAPAGTLSAENVARAVEVALADTPGTIVGVSVDDDLVRDAYSVDVLGTDGLSVTEFDLDTSFTVTEVERDHADDLFD